MSETKQASVENAAIIWAASKIAHVEAGGV